MSKGKKISAFVAATAVMLSTVGYFPVATTYATSTTCQAQAYNLAGNELNNLADGGTYIVHGDATGDLEFNPGWGVNKSVTIDLAGCTLNGQIRVSGGTVTIIDTSADKTGAVAGGSNHNTAARSQYGGNLVITGGTFEKVVNGNNVTISGGKFTSGNANFVSQHLADDTYGMFTLNDNRVIVEKKLTEDDVTFPDDVELAEGETKDFVVAVETDSEVLHVDYTPVSNDYFEIANSQIAGKSAGESETKITVKQGDTLVAEKTVAVNVIPALEWVRVKDWSNDDDYEPSAISRPYNGHCMGHRVMEAGETFDIELEYSRDGIEPEVTIEVTGNTAMMDETLPVATVDGATLKAENVSEAYYGYDSDVRIVVKATYNGKTVTAHGHLRVMPTIHEIIEGDGAEYSGDKLVQKIDADETKLRYVYICPVNAWDNFVEKYGYDDDEWSEEAWAEYEKFEELCDTPVDPSNYEVTHGSTVVTFANAWLDTLDLGEYDVWYEFTDGYAEGTFVIAEKKQNEVEIVLSSATVTVADTGVMTTPEASEGVRSTFGGTIAAAVAATVAAAAVVFAKRKARK